jgi:lipopolysaccharide/colanic/teichoic acid biosynthesis glycosyltransferase
MIRFFDIVFSLFGLILFSPIILIISIWIKLDSPGPILYKQVRVGLNGVDFILLKFRSMRVDSDRRLLITVGNHNNSITKSGYLIRKLKLDELPQLLNVLKGDMSLVGPRPEVRKYVNLYNEAQRVVLSIKPGLTDYSSVAYRNENELLAQVQDPEEYYIKTILPEKIKLNLIYIRKRSLFQYFKILFLTLALITK